MNRFNSTNAKEIGTLYLIFAIFAGICTISWSSSGSGIELITSTSKVTETGTVTGGRTSEYLNNAIDKVDLGGAEGSNFIPSFIDGSLSFLEMLINCKILINILFHIMKYEIIYFILLILIQNFNIKIVTNSSVGFISKNINKYKYKYKLQNFIYKIGEMNNIFLSLLIINVIIIVFYIFLNVYINTELSNNLNEYIYVYNKFHFNKGGIFLLLLNCNIKYKNSNLLVRYKNKYVNRLEQRMYSCSNKVNNSNSDNYSNSNSNILLNEKKLFELIDDHLNYKSVVGKKRKLYKDDGVKTRSDEYEKYHHEISFSGLLVERNLLSEYDLIKYDQKVKILNIWWNEKKNRSLHKRYEYFKKESLFYSQISDILNLKDENISSSTKQLRLEKWIIDSENYRIRDLIKKGDIDRSTECKIYSNIFRSFDKNWNNRLSLYKINNYRELKKIYNRSNEKNNINCNIKFLDVFIYITMGSLNTFSLLFNKTLEHVFKEGGIKYNELVIRLGEHLISNFYRQLKKEFNVEYNTSDLERLSCGENSLDMRNS